jgi:FixJ family two-component response regulator
LTNRPLISIVEDDSIVRDAVEDLVRSLGYDAATFASAEEYLLSGLSLETFCLISDLQLPGVSGADLQERLIAIGQPTPMVFLTAVCDGVLRARVLKYGAVGVLRKPFDEATLIEYLEMAIKAS